MTGHAQLKFVMKECSKTQIRLTRLIYLISLRRGNYNNYDGHVLKLFGKDKIIIDVNDIVLMDKHNYNNWSNKSQYVLCIKHHRKISFWIAQLDATIQFIVLMIAIYHDR